MGRTINHAPSNKAGIDYLDSIGYAPPSEHMECGQCGISWSKYQAEIAELKEQLGLALKAGKYFLQKYESAMQSEYDFPNSDWSMERDNDEESIKMKEVIARANSIGGAE